MTATATVPIALLCSVTLYSPSATDTIRYLFYSYRSFPGVGSKQTPPMGTSLYLGTGLKKIPLIFCTLCFRINL